MTINEETEAESKTSGSEQSSPRGVLEIPILDSDSSISSRTSEDDKPVVVIPKSQTQQWWSLLKKRRLIGKGGHAEVYEGKLADGRVVAVKRVIRRDTEEERIEDFLSELGIIAHVDHPNTAHLLGFGVEGGLHLVLQFSPHGSLASLLHGSKGSLDWTIRFKVALGIAEGLLYLHQGCHRRIIHRDIKASNILLTEDYEPQISDFGLAKWLPDQWTHHVVFPIEGTFGTSSSRFKSSSLVIWAKPFLDSWDTKELVDPSMKGVYNHEEMKLAMVAASMCIHHLSAMRPPMKQVVQLLKGEETITVEMMRGEKMKMTIAQQRSPLLLESSDFEDYTCSRYLSDLNRHKQLALEQ
ncbi:Receptor-like cytosolic serine/threonine-protein kinase RBK1 [Acorus calamus]|uniref:non-specific serine/threonine protein kinase n=1 Tax=Acorus calamus TaxID=4465 RepID=A0AAV9FE03_ACOCL|nr:Receptor-like cytosolic serine/threonine-protein kinase RBK1 [Acorus calamus]